MARRTRCADAGYVYHVLNRAVGRATLFEKQADGPEGWIFVRYENIDIPGSFASRINLLGKARLDSLAGVDGVALAECQWSPKSRVRRSILLS